MLPTTAIAIRSIMTADSTISVQERNRLMILLRKEPKAAPEPAQVEKPVAKLITRAEVARRLSRCPRTVDRLAASGALTIHRLPGRRRGCGFLEDDVNKLIGSVGAN